MSVFLIMVALYLGLVQQRATSNEYIDMKLKKRIAFLAYT